MLHFLDQGVPGAAPLVILHGLFGALDNWQTLGRRWADEAGLRVVSVDLRNHGRSFHHPTHTYPALAADVLALLDHLGLDPARLTLLGHSMGGKVAMRLALDQPARLARLVVLDIAPRASDMAHQQPIVAGLLALNPAAIGSRAEADAVLARHIGQPDVRQFLLKSLFRQADNSFAWRFNLPVLAASLPAIGAAVGVAAGVAIGVANGVAAGANTGRLAETSGGEATFFQKPALFLRGGKSDYVTTHDKLYVIPALFPNSEVVTLPDAGHWLHAERPSEVYELVRAFGGSSI